MKEGERIQASIERQREQMRLNQLRLRKGVNVGSRALEEKVLNFEVGSVIDKVLSLISSLQRMYLVKQRKRLQVTLETNKLRYLEQILPLQEPVEKLLLAKGWHTYNIFHTLMIKQLEELQAHLLVKHLEVYRLLDDLARRRYRYQDIDSRVT